MLSIVVCVKAVPDPDEADEIRIDPVTKTLPRQDVPLVINPLDRNALEAALQFKEEGKAHVTVVSMGPPPAGKVVKECLALGADKGVLLTDPAFAGADAYATAFTLAKAIQKQDKADCVLCGRASSDGATEWVGPEIATFLDMPVVTMVREFVETGNAKWKVKTDFESGYRLVEVEMPAVFTVTKDLNTPRTLRYSGIIKARKKEITTWGMDELDVSESSVGLKGSPTVMSDLAYIERKSTCQFIEGTLEEKADFLIQKMMEVGVL